MTAPIEQLTDLVVDHTPGDRDLAARIATAVIAAGWQPLPPMSLPFDIRATVDDGVVHLDLDGQTLAKTKPAVHAALLAWLGAHDIGATEIPSLARITVNTADGTITFPMITQVDGELVVVNGELHRTLTTRRPSKVQPFPTELQELVECTHPDAFDVRLLCEDATTSRCPDCGHTWTTAEPIDTEGDDLA